MLVQDAPAKRVYLAEGDSLEAARPLQPEAKAAYSAEKIENGIGHNPALCFHFAACFECHSDQREM